ncbi:MAG TPA: cupin domain-containing protein [Chloroflexi bacterium]|nr:cupin domain-containing protein [Chloroflexota bacterium]
MNSTAFLHVTDFIRTPGEKSFKHTFFQSERLLVGLNVLGPGQVQALHAHPDQDKFYYVVAGSGRFTVGETSQTCTAGMLILAPAGAPHGASNDGEDLLVFLTVIAPFG